MEPFPAFLERERDCCLLRERERERERERKKEREGNRDRERERGEGKGIVPSRKLSLDLRKRGRHPTLSTFPIEEGTS